MFMLLLCANKEDDSDTDDVYLHNISAGENNSYAYRSCTQQRSLEDVTV